MKQILIILEDVMSRFVQSTGAIQDIKEHYRDDHVVLLTTKNLQLLAESNPHVDEVAYSRRGMCYSPIYWLQVRRFLRQFDVIFDLQHDQRSKRYAWLAEPERRWCGSYPDAALPVHHQVFSEQSWEGALRVQLSMAKVPSWHQPDVTYAAADASEVLQAHNLHSGRYAVLIPGSRRSCDYRRWPHFAQLGAMMKAKGWSLAVVGAADEERLVYKLAEDLDIPLLYNLPVPKLIDVLQKSALVIGNDTGPFYLAAACGVEGVALFGPEQEIHRHMPHLTHVSILENTDDIAAISPQAVMQILTHAPY